MLHPTQNRPPRAQAIRERREMRARRLWRTQELDIRNDFWSGAITQGVVLANHQFSDEAKTIREVSHG